MYLKDITKHFLLNTLELQTFRILIGIQSKWYYRDVNRNVINISFEVSYFFGQLDFLPTHNISQILNFSTKVFCLSQQLINCSFGLISNDFRIHIWSMIAFPSFWWFLAYFKIVHPRSHFFHFLYSILFYVINVWQSLHYFKFWVIFSQKKQHMRFSQFLTNLG